MIACDGVVPSEDVQLLASRDALTAFFTRLGYNTNDRLTQSIAAKEYHRLRLNIER